MSSAFAAWRLMTNSNLVDCNIGSAFHVSQGLNAPGAMNFSFSGGDAPSPKDAGCLGSTELHRTAYRNPTEGVRSLRRMWQVGLYPWCVFDSSGP
jgi:hypothetical protein